MLPVVQIGIVGISAGPANAADTVAAMIEDRNYKRGINDRVRR